MNAKKVVKFLNVIEREPSVIAWKYNDLDFWPLLRIELYSVITSDLMGVKDTNRAGSRVKSMVIGNLKFPLKHLQDFCKNAVFEKKDFLLLSDGISFTKVNDKSFEKFLDPLKMELDSRDLSSLRLDPYHNYHLPRYTASIFIQHLLDPIIIKEFLSKRQDRSLHQMEIDILHKILRDYNLERFNSVIDKALLKARLIYKISVFFEKKLRKVQPKIVFIVWYYGVYGMAMILACRRLFIPTVDLQHGVQGELHAAYGSWDNVPKQGYNLLPNYFWCWSNEEIQAINEWSSSTSSHKPILGGNMLLEMWNPIDLPFVSDFEKKFKALAINGFRILVTLSPGISSPKVLDNLFQVIAATQHQYEWMVRIHPNMLTEMDKVIDDLKSYGIEKYEIKEVSKLPLYTILKHTDLHITHSSSTILEASVLGIPNLIVNEYGRELYQKQIKEEQAKVAIGVEEIISKISSAKNRDKIRNEVVINISKLAIDKLLMATRA